MNIRHKIASNESIIEIDFKKFLLVFMGIEVNALLMDLKGA